MSAVTVLGVFILGVPAALQIGVVERSLSEHLKDVRRKLKCTSIAYVALIKDTHLLEIPQASLLRPLPTPGPFPLHLSVLQGRKPLMPYKAKAGLEGI